MYKKILNYLFSFYPFLFIPKRNASKIADKIDENVLQKFSNYKLKEGNNSLFVFNNHLISNLVKSAKYENNSKSIKLIKKSLKNFIEYVILERAGIENKDYFLVVIPETDIRKKRDGYNFMEKIAEDISSDLEEVVFLKNFFKWTRKTNRQSRIKNKRKRIENMENALEIRNEYKIGIYFVLDDVVTTGATLTEARRVLEKENLEVISLAFARSSFKKL